MQRPLIEKHTYENRLYRIYHAMNQRCNNPNASRYDIYGGRGIKVCAEWSGDGGFDRFREWAVSHGYADDLEIDRINNDLGYKPSNCRWISHQKNMYHRRVRNSCGVPGIHYRKDIRKWTARLTFADEIKYLGSFKTKEEAIEARQKAERELGLRNE